MNGEERGGGGTNIKNLNMINDSEIPINSWFDND